MKVFTVTEIAKGLSGYQQLIEWWMKRGLLTPSIRKSPAQGSPHLFSEDDIVYVVLLKMLLSLGVKYRDINEPYLRGTLTRNTSYRVVRWKCECRFSSLHVVSAARYLFGIDPYEERESNIAGLPTTWVQL